MKKDMSSHTYFKRCLQALKLTNKDLANLLSSEREDGQKTSEATISRWATGVSPIDPGVRLYLKTRLFELAEKSPPRPAHTQLIGVGGCKGGSGASSLSAAAAVTLKELGYRVLHVTTMERCNNKHLIDEMSNYVDCITVNTEDFKKIVGNYSSGYDFVLIDMYNRLILDTDDEPENLSLLNSINLLVSPIDISSTASMWALKQAYSLLDSTQCGNRLIVNFNQNLDCHIGLHDAFLKEMKPWAEFLYPHTLPMVYGPLFANKLDNPRTGTQKLSLQSIDLEYRYQGLAIAMLELIGVELDSKPVRDLDFHELVDRVT